MLSALFSRFYAPARLARFYRQLLALLAGIPSVVYGLWGLVVLVPLIRRLHPPGPSLLAGMLILAVMILPTVALSADASLADLPEEYRLGGAALGLGRWPVIRGVLLPAAMPGITAGIILGSGRALGETMAVLMVGGNVVRMPDSLFAPMRTLAANIALEMAYALDLHRAALFASGLLLMALIAVFVTAAGAARKKRYDA